MKQQRQLRQYRNTVQYAGKTGILEAGTKMRKTDEYNDESKQ